MGRRRLRRWIAVGLPALRRRRRAGEGNLFVKRTLAAAAPPLMRLWTQATFSLKIEPLLLPLSFPPFLPFAFFFPLHFCIYSFCQDGPRREAAVRAGEREKEEPKTFEILINV